MSQDSTIYGNIRTTIYGNLHTRTLQVMVWASDEQVLEALCGPATYSFGLGGVRFREPQWVDFLGDVDEITPEQALARASAGQGVAATFLTSYPAAPGLGIRAGRPFAPPPIHEGTQVWFPGLVAARGEGPGCATVQDATHHAIHWFALEGKLVKMPEWWRDIK